MSGFESRWVRWSDSDTSCQGTAKTAKTPKSEPQTPSQGTAKTAKTRFGSFGSALPAHSGPVSEAVNGASEMASVRRVPTPEEIAAMPIDEFAIAGLTVTVRSEALDCRVLFVSDNVPDEAIEANGLPVYRVAELRKLAQLRPAPGTIRCLNEIKAVFGGTIEVGEHD